MVSPKVCRQCTINYANNNPSEEGVEADELWLKNRLKDFDRMLSEDGKIICYADSKGGWIEMVMKDDNWAIVRVDEEPPEDCMCILEQVVLHGKIE